MSTAITLPGGALIDGQVVRAAMFRPLTGRLEQQLAAAAELPSVPHRVSAVLATALAYIGKHPMTEAVAARLSVSDRQFLVLAVALEFGDDQQWRHLICSRCRARFDVGFRLSELPLTPAGDGYPFAETIVSGRRLRLRVPTGEDEAQIIELAPGDARRTLACRCVVAIDGDAPSDEALAALDDAAIDAIDAALDAVAPQLATVVSTACSECGTAHSLEIDPYRMPALDTEALYRDVHTLALRYHWSEAQCLRLPRDRRQIYVDLIDQSRGMNH